MDLVLGLFLFLAVIHLIYSILWPWSAANRRSRREKVEQLERLRRQTQAAIENIKSRQRF
jgi:hypothetical protein